MRGVRTSKTTVDLCIRLREAGWSLGEICTTTGIAKTTVSSIVRLVILSEKQKRTIQQKLNLVRIKTNTKRRGISRPHNRPSIFPNSITPALIECVAHFSFDGSLRGSTSSYYNRSTNLINRQQLLVSRLFGLSGKVICYPNDIYRLNYYSVELTNILISYRAQIFENISSCSLAWKQTFLRAFFDDEGNIDISGSRRRVRGYQRNLDRLVLMRELLTQIGIRSSIDQQGWCVVITGYDNLLLFQKLINFSHGIYMNPKRKNSRYKSRVEKRSLLKKALVSYQKRSLERKISL